MIMKYLIFSMLLCFFSQPENCTFKSGAIQTGNWELEKISRNNLEFKNGIIVKTNLYDLTYIKTLYTNSGTPYLIMSGKSCEKCDENPSIFVHNPENGNFDVNEVNKYVYPGKLFDYLGGKIIFSSRLFIGNCSNENISLIWMQKFYTNTDSTIKENFFVLSLLDEAIKESLYDNFILDENNFCIELEGKDFTSEP